MLGLVASFAFFLDVTASTDTDSLPVTGTFEYGPPGANDGELGTRRMQEDEAICGSLFDCFPFTSVTWCDESPGANGFGCFCTQDVETNPVCAQSGWCSDFTSCSTNDDCDGGSFCVPDTCCGNNICLSDCENPLDNALPPSSPAPTVVPTPITDEPTRDPTEEPTEMPVEIIRPIEACDTEACDCNDESVDPFCKVCNYPDGPGCSQCRKNYFKFDYNYPCAKCRDIFEGCKFCQDFIGCGQCRWNYVRQYDDQMAAYVCRACDELYGEGCRVCQEQGCGRCRNGYELVTDEDGVTVCIEQE